MRQAARTAATLSTCAGSRRHPLAAILTWRAGSGRSARRRPRLPALHQPAPALDLNLDAVLSGSRLDAPPGRLPLAVTDALDLVKAGDRVANVPCIVQRFLSLPWEGERLRRHPIFLFRAQASSFLRDTSSLRARTL